MKKGKFKAFLVLLLALSFISLPVRAEELLTTTSVEDTSSYVNEAYFKADNEVNVSESVLGSSFVAGNNVTVGGTVDGVLFEAGNNVKHSGTATYAAIAGNMVEIAGNYEKDVAIAGNIISVRNETVFGRDAVIVGSEVTLSGVVERDIAIYAEIVNLENATIKGSAEIFAEQVNFGENSKINGNLKTSVDNIDKKYVDGEITVEELKEVNFEISYKTIIIEKVVSYLSLLFTFVVLFLLFPKLFEKTSNTEFSFMKALSLCGYGLIFLVFVPFVSIMVMVTTIGIPVSLIALVVYCIALYLSNIFTGYYVGQYIWKNVFKKDDNALVHTLIGISLLFVLSLIPYIGVLVSFISFIIGLGLILETMKKK